MAKELETNRKYWLVRTFGGKYYDHFVQNNYIAIGWNELSDIEMIKNADNNGVAKEQLFNKAKELYSKKETDQMGRIVNPIIKFVKDMAIGDVVVIPSKNSKEIHFGIIKSDVNIVKDVINLDEGLEPLYKQRTVDWVIWRDKDSVDLNIFKMLASHYAISSVDAYAESIDRTMYSFYVKGDKAYLVIKVSKEGEYEGTEIPDLINQFIGTINIYNKLTGKSLNKNDVKTKVSLQSDGFALFSGSVESIAVMIGIAVLLTGGSYELLKLFKISTPGVIPMIWSKILETREQTHKHKLETEEQEFRHIMGTLKITLPVEDMVGATLSQEAITEISTPVNTTEERIQLNLGEDEQGD